MQGNVTIEAVEYLLAPHRITSTEIESVLKDTWERLNISPGLIEQLTGIRERRFWDEGVMPSEVATHAARKLFDTYPIDPSEIGCIINTSVCKDFIEPSVASLVHGNLALSPACLNFDVGNACVAFLNAIDIMGLMIEAGKIKYGLIVDGESSRDVIESTINLLNKPTTTDSTYRDHFATLTLGSGAVAMLLTHKKYSKTGHVINNSMSLSDTRHSRLCLGQKDHMKADAVGVLKYGVTLAHQTWERAAQAIENWSDDTIDLYIPHQVSFRNMTVLNQTLGLTPEKSYLNFYNQGNIGPAAVPITLAMANEEDLIQSQDHVALLGIGSGLNCTMMSVTW